jgi:hypothetical protein
MTAGRCVENICWIRMQRDHRVVAEPGTFFNRTKLTLLVFRMVRSVCVCEHVLMGVQTVLAIC